MSSSVLRKVDKSGGKPFSLRIPVELHERLEKVKDRAKKKGFEIPINQKIIDLIDDTCKTAEGELDQMRERMEDDAIAEQQHASSLAHKQAREVVEQAKIPK